MAAALRAAAIAFSSAEVRRAARRVDDGPVAKCLPRRERVALRRL
jgi:hypothetical protein